MTLEVQSVGNIEFNAHLFLFVLPKSIDLLLNEPNKMFLRPNDTCEKKTRHAPINTIVANFFRKEVIQIGKS